MGTYEEDGPAGIYDFITTEDAKLMKEYEITNVNSLVQEFNFACEDNDNESAQVLSGGIYYSRPTVLHYRPCTIEIMNEIIHSADEETNY